MNPNTTTLYAPGVAEIISPPAEAVEALESVEKSLLERPTRNFTEFYFPAREKKPPKQTKIEVTNEKGEKETISMTDFKLARRVHFTVRRDNVDFCGHKIDLYAGPKNNCRSCWFAYFNQHAELVKSLDEAYALHGSEVIDATRGRKFRKRFMQFLAEVAYMRREQALRTYDGQTEVNGETILGAASGSGNEESGAADAARTDTDEIN